MCSVFLYGREDPERFPGNFALHSAMLEFVHPIAGEKMKFVNIPSWAEEDVLLVDMD